jgi:TonB-dependent SusC/RagA subfamily outer membrane receptor
LYVVDGTIIPSASDINPDDIEDVTVLQGPSAAALFGAEGSNGAIVINTKKAKRGSRNLGIEINSTVQFDKVYVLPDYQNSYAGGDPAVSFANGQHQYMQQFNYIPGVHPAGWAALDGKYYPDYQEDASWGPRISGQEYIPWYAWYPGTEYSYKTAKLTAQPNNARDFFNTGITKLNNVNFTKGGDIYNFRVSYTNLNQTGIIPNSWLKKNTFNVGASIDLSSRFTLAANITYINQKSNAENDDGYANNTSGSFNNWFHRDLDINILKELRGLKTPEGILATWNHSNPDSYSDPVSFFRSYYWFNPYAWQDNVSNANNRDRLFGDASLTYKVNNDLNFRFTYRKQQLGTDYETRQYKALETSAAGNNLAGFNYWETVANRSATWQGYAFGNTQSNRQNYEFLASYKKKIKDFSIGANAGLDILKTRYKQFDWNSTGGLLVADEFLTANSKTTPNISTVITNTGRRSLFIRADVGFRNFIFVEGTFRKDYSSTEAKDYSINTKSVGLSFVFSDLINKGHNTFLSYGKIRGSFGQVLNTLGAYQNTVLYNATNPPTYPVTYGGSTRVITEPNTLVDPLLHGAVNTEKEIGVELRFLKNRLGLTFTYWDRTNKDFPLNVAISPLSGYNAFTTNAGEVQKKGVDVQMFINPVKSKNLDWTINATWGRLLSNKIVSIAPGIIRTTAISSGQGGSDATAGGGQAYLINEVGEDWGQLVGKGIQRDKNGVPVISTDPSSYGQFVLDSNLTHFGSSIPKYTGGVQNSFTVLKNFIINVNIDYSFGGKYFSTSTMYGNYSGLLAETAGLNDKGNSVRDDVADGGGVHVVGVDKAGKPIDIYMDARTYYHQFVDGARIGEPYIKDLTFVKLRELSLGYILPVQRLGIGKYITNATFSVVARNPWLIYAKSKGFDPSEISTNYGEDAQLPGTRSIGVNLKLGF